MNGSSAGRVLSPEEGAFLLIDKPGGPSSFAVVSAVRRQLKVKKAGHAGTLDPAASGLLVLAFGQHTRLLPYLPLEPKQYRFTVQFGSQTDTLDGKGSAVKSGGPLPGADALKAVLPSFTGTIMQTPPEYSAVKVAGERAYARARQGEVVDLKPRPVEIRSLECIAYDPVAGRAELEVVCGGGTYVRSLARDIALALGTFGYADAIRRTGVGLFQVEKALLFDRLDAAGSSLLTAAEALQGLPRITVAEAQIKRLSTGSDIPCEGTVSSAGGNPEIVFAFAESGAIVAVLRHLRDDRYHPEKVFLTSSNDALSSRHS